MTYDLLNNFSYHAPFGNQAERYEQLRNAGREMAERFIMQVPESRELSIALTKLEEAIMWANAGIARNEGIKPVINE